MSTFGTTRLRHMRASALWTRHQCQRAGGAGAGLAPLRSLFFAIKCPLPIDIRQTMPADITGMIKNDGTFATTIRPRDAAALLQEQRQGARRTQQDSDLCARHIEALAEKVDARKEIYLAAPELFDDIFTGRAIDTAIEMRRIDAGRLEALDNVLTVLDVDAKGEGRPLAAKA